MIPAQFDYLSPGSVEEVIQALAHFGDDAKIIAGGQSLLPVLRMRLNAPQVVVDLGKIDSLRGIRDDGDAIVIGAMTTHHDVMHDALVREHALLVTKAATEVADAQIRHRGTFGGALAHADPAGDLGAPALALGAEFVIAGPGGTRTVGADDFFVDLFETAIGEDEILTEVRIPKHTGWGAHYEKFVRVAHQWPIVAVAATVRVDGDAIAEARVGLTNMGSTPLRARGVEEAVAFGATASEDGVAEAAQLAAEGTNPPSRPQRLSGLPAAPGQGAHPSSGRRGDGRGLERTPWSSPTGSPSPSRSRRPGRTSTTSPRSPSASPARPSPRRTTTASPDRSRSSSARSRWSTTGPAPSPRRTTTAHRFVVDAKGKDKRGNGTAGAVVTMAMREAGSSTDVEVLTDLAITGKPAQFGRGVMQDVSDKLLGQFVACLEQRFATAAADRGRRARHPHPRRSSSSRPRPHADRRDRSGGGRGPPRPPLAASAPRRRAPRRTTPSTSAPPCSRSWPGPTGSTPSPCSSWSSWYLAGRGPLMRSAGLRKAR